MASLSDLADLIAANRAALERTFESALVKLRVKYGDRAVAQALQLAREAERSNQVSISGNRQRHQREMVTAREKQKILRTKTDDERTSELPLPPGWR